jgi:hypothetical protein
VRIMGKGFVNHRFAQKLISVSVECKRCLPHETCLGNVCCGERGKINTRNNSKQKCMHTYIHPKKHKLNYAVEI